jgi:hypothetical protein
MRQLSTRWWFWLTGVIVAGCLTVLALCWSYRVWSFDGWRVYRAMATECPPAWRDYHYGHVRAGDPVEEVITRTQPVAVTRKGRWVGLRYHKEGGGLCFAGMTATAHDGRMVCAYAYSCTWVRVFFDELSDEQYRELIGAPPDEPLRRWDVAGVVR